MQTVSLENMLNTFRAGVVTLTSAAVAVLFWAAPVKGLDVKQYEADYENSQNNNVLLDISITNDDSGAIYDSASVSMFDDIAAQIYALDHNQSAYAARSDMTAEWSFQIRTPPTGEVENGWNENCGNWSCIDIYNIGGIPNVTYTQWLSTSSDPDQDMMAITVGIPKAQLDGNQNGWDPNDPADYLVTLDPNLTLEDSVVGKWGVSWFHGDSNAYILQPAVGCVRADLNADGYVNFFDYVKVARDWLQSGEYLEGDVNGDGFVGLADLRDIGECWMFE